MNAAFGMVALQHSILQLLKPSAGVPPRPFVAADWRSSIGTTSRDINKEHSGGQFMEKQGGLLFRRGGQQQQRYCCLPTRRAQPQ
jgi:hypothetical protein